MNSFHSASVIVSYDPRADANSSPAGNDSVAVCLISVAICALVLPASIALVI